jgi:cell division protein FtsI (penicillin-binding protein 3)
MHVPGVDVHPHQRRTYPQGPLAAHLIGFAGAETQGLEGIELLFDERLGGEPRIKRVCKDVRGRVFYSTQDLGGMNQGESVELTIDATLQSIAEAELNAQVTAYKAVGGTAIVLDPRTGAVLAMANAPGFDPNDYRSSPEDSRRNRAVTDIFEPGSTLKPFVIAAGLDAQVVATTDVLFCENGAYRIGGRTIHDHHPHGHLSIPEILQVSSNICTVKVGQRLGAERLHGYLREFGFGRPTQVGLPGDSTGMLAAPGRWRLINLATISFGQGLAASALQMASAFGTLANDGVRMKPYVVARVTRPDGTVVSENEPTAEGQVVAAHIARQISSMLELVVGPGGTAQRAKIEGVRVAGKTGTAQKAENGGYSKDRWLSSFVGYLPADDPRLVVVVVVDEPKGNHFGGVVAAPVFRAIAEASLDYLHIERAPPGAARPAPPDFDGTMPDLHGFSLRSAMRAMDGCECSVRVEGAGYVVSQEPAPGGAVTQPTPVVLRLASLAP